MGQRKNPPLLRREPLSKRVTILTRYQRKNGHIRADEKWDCHDDFEVLASEWAAEVIVEDLRRALLGVAGWRAEEDPCWCGLGDGHSKECHEAREAVQRATRSGSGVA